MATYNKITPEIAEQLKAVVGDKRFSAGEEVDPNYSHDEMPIYGSYFPEVTVDVESTEEVSKIMKICNDNKIPVTCRGAGTGLVGGCVPLAGGVVLCTRRMNKILHYDMDNLVVRIQPGVLLKDLAADALAHGLMYPPDPGEKTATVGGNISTNAGGMRAVKYGCTRDYVRAMTVVLPTGEIIKLGATVSKTSTGYSLLHLMIGSEGTLGIITELTLKVIPAPKETVSLIIPFENLDDCIATVPLFMKNRLNPQAVEFMEREIVLASERFIGRETFPKSFGGVEVGAYLLVTFDGDDFDQLNDLVEKAAEVVLEEGAIDVLVADSPAKKRDAWAARSSFLEAIEAETTWLDECDVVVPVTKIAEYLKYVKSTEDRYCFKIKSFGHAGDGNLHIYACGDDTVDEATFKKDVEVFMKDIYAKAAEMGGLISGEHGIGHGKMEFLADFSGDAQMRIMEGIKQVFDPKMILNPGKVCYKVR